MLKLIVDDTFLFSIGKCVDTSASILNSNLLKIPRLDIPMESAVTLF